MSRVINDVFTFHQQKLKRSFFSGRFVITGAFNQTDNHLQFPFFPFSIEAETEFRTNGYFRICKHFFREVKTLEIVHSNAGQMLRNKFKVHEQSQSVLKRSRDVTFVCSCMLQHIYSTFTAHFQTYPKIVKFCQKSVSPLSPQVCESRKMFGGYVQA